MVQRLQEGEKTGLLQKWSSEEPGSESDESSYVSNRDREKKRNTHKTVLKDLIPSESSISMNQLYPEYCERVPDPQERRTVRNYITQLQEEGEIQKLGSGPGTTYRKNEISDSSLPGSLSAISLYVDENLLQRIKEQSGSGSRALEEEFNKVLRKGLDEV